MKKTELHLFLYTFLLSSDYLTSLLDFPPSGFGNSVIYYNNDFKHFIRLFFKIHNSFP